MKIHYVCALDFCDTVPLSSARLSQQLEKSSLKIKKERIRRISSTSETKYCQGHFQMLLLIVFFLTKVFSSKTTTTTKKQSESLTDNSFLLRLFNFHDIYIFEVLAFFSEIYAMLLRKCKKFFKGKTKGELGMQGGLQKVEQANAELGKAQSEFLTNNFISIERFFSISQSWWSGVYISSCDSSSISRFVCHFLILLPPFCYACPQQVYTIKQSNTCYFSMRVDEYFDVILAAIEALCRGP